MLSKDAVMKTLQCSEDQYPHTLEKNFPHVLEKIVELWGKPACDGSIADLLQPIGSGGRLDRSGFPPDAWDEIMQLGELHRKLRELSGIKADE